MYPNIWAIPTSTRVPSPMLWGSNAAISQLFCSSTTPAQALIPAPRLSHCRTNPAALYFLCSGSESLHPWRNAWIHCYVLLILPHASLKWRYYGRPTKLLCIFYIYTYIMWFIVNAGSLKTRADLPPSDKAVLPNHRTFSNLLCS